LQSGRFINKLVNDRLEFYQTTDAEKLLNDKNLKAVWNLSREEPGEYKNKFLDDMAITNTMIASVYDSTGREMRENDTIIVKFDDLDRDRILDTMNESMNLLGTMRKLQHNNGIELMNPLPNVEF